MNRKERRAAAHKDRKLARKAIGFEAQRRKEEEHLIKSEQHQTRSYPRSPKQKMGTGTAL